MKISHFSSEVLKSKALITKCEIQCSSIQLSTLVAVPTLSWWRKSYYFFLSRHTCFYSHSEEDKTHNQFILPGSMLLSCNLTEAVYLKSKVCFSCSLKKAVWTMHIMFLNYAPREWKNSNEDWGFEEGIFLFLTSIMKISFFKKRKKKKKKITLFTRAAGHQYISVLYTDRLFNIWSSISFALAELFICLCCINGSVFEIMYW